VADLERFKLLLEIIQPAAESPIKSVLRAGISQVAEIGEQGRVAPPFHQGQDGQGRGIIGNGGLHLAGGMQILQPRPILGPFEVHYPDFLVGLHPFSGNSPHNMGSDGISHPSVIQRTS